MQRKYWRLPDKEAGRIQTLIPPWTAVLSCFFIFKKIQAQNRNYVLLHLVAAIGKTYVGANNQKFAHPEF
jgi:hypothetical protein